MHSETDAEVRHQERENKRERARNQHIVGYKGALEDHGARFLERFNEMEYCLAMLLDGADEVDDLKFIRRCEKALGRPTEGSYNMENRRSGPKRRTPVKRRGDRDRRFRTGGRRKHRKHRRKEDQ